MIELHHNYFQQVMPRLEDNSIDLIATDPPYAKEYLHLYFDLVREAKRVLKRGGALLTILPHHSMPDILSEFGNHLKWRWLLEMWQWDGPHPRMAMGIEIVHKPIGWWVKEAWNPQNTFGKGMFFKDGFLNSPPAKEAHPWEQSIDWARYCVKFAPEGSTVLDPMMGTGTIGLACVEKNMRFIGIDNDIRQFNTAREALGGFI